MADSTEQFKQLTGADDATAQSMLAATNGDLERALALHFDAAGDDDETPPAATPQAADAAPPTLPGSEPADLVGSILSHAKQEGDGDKDSSASPWGGAGRALGSSLADASSSIPASEAPEAPAAPDPPAAPARHNPKKVRVIFWADGFTVEDVTAEEQVATAAALAEKNAPRRTGVVGLGSSRERQQPQMPKIPELRPYDQNQEFMEDLKQGIPPVEFRETDLSTGVPRPRPVDIMLGDMRPQSYPAEALRRLRPPAAEQQPPAKPAVRAFSGQGRTLADEGSSASVEATAGAAGEWPSAGQAAPEVDSGAPTTEVQVRVAGSAPQRLKLNTSHTVGDFKCLLERSLEAAGHTPRGYVLSAGFPPKPVTDETATLEAAGLLNAAVTHRWV